VNSPPSGHARYVFVAAQQKAGRGMSVTVVIQRAPLDRKVWRRPWSERRRLCESHRSGTDRQSERAAALVSIFHPRIPGL